MNRSDTLATLLPTPNGDLLLSKVLYRLLLVESLQGTIVSTKTFYITRKHLKECILTDLSFSCHAGVTGTAILSVSSKAYHNVLIALYTRFIVGRV
jgi:hypothetical protein